MHHKQAYFLSRQWGEAQYFNSICTLVTLENKILDLQETGKRTLG